MHPLTGSSLRVTSGASFLLMEKLVRCMVCLPMLRASGARYGTVARRARPSCDDTGSARGVLLCGLA